MEDDDDDDEDDTATYAYHAHCNTPRACMPSRKGEHAAIDLASRRRRALQKKRTQNYAHTDTMKDDTMPVIHTMMIKQDSYAQMNTETVARTRYTST